MASYIWSRRRNGSHSRNTQKTGAVLSLGQPCLGAVGVTARRRMARREFTVMSRERLARVPSSTGGWPGNESLPIRNNALRRSSNTIRTIRQHDSRVLASAERPPVQCRSSGKHARQISPFCTPQLPTPRKPQAADYGGSICGPRDEIATVRGRWDCPPGRTRSARGSGTVPGAWSPGGPVARAGGARKDDADGIERWRREGGSGDGRQ